MVNRKFQLMTPAHHHEEQWKSEKLPQVVAQIVESCKDNKGINQSEETNLPSKRAISEVLDMLFMLLLPGFTTKEPISRANIPYYIGNLVNSIFEELLPLVEKSYRYHCGEDICKHCDCRQQAMDAVTHLIESIPRIREMIKGDVEAAYKGDPAAGSCEEIIVSYPAVEAIGTYRLAHELYLKKVPLIPRIMSEFAHSKTGIDIHPGAQIGQNFFIDHGTGVVIGETTVIGDNVKLYQGVTLGALSIKVDENGAAVRGKKRHPTIEDDVVIYSGATILGGNTIIRKGSVIGGNVWLTESVEPFTKVFLKNPELLMRENRVAPDHIAAQTYVI
jgi:serine O-acetyltransferase